MATDDNNKQPATAADEPEQDVYSGVRWSALSKYGAQGMQFVVSIVLARLLAPEYFGLLAMATVVTGFLRAFRMLGFGSAIVQRKEVTGELLSTLFWVQLAVCILVALLTLGIAPVAGWLYQDGRVPPIIAVLSLNLIFSGFTMVPSAILNRQMAFNKLAVREIGGVLINGGTAVTLAVLGYGVWALVWGTLAGSMARAVLLNVVCPFRPRFVFDHRGFKESMSFGLNLTGASFFEYFTKKSDSFLIGLFLGATPLGFYSLAYRLMMLPNEAIGGVVSRVLFPAFSRMQGDSERLTRAFLRACGAIAFMAFPMMAGLALLAQPFVELVLGGKWLPAVPLLWILAPMGALHALWAPTKQLLIAKGHTHLYVRFVMFRGALFVLSFLAGLPWGITGVAAAFAITCALCTVASFILVIHLLPPLTRSDVVNALRPYAIGTAVMSGFVSLAHWGMVSFAVPPLATFVLSVAVGMAVYFAFGVITRYRAIDDLLLLIPQPVTARVHRLAPWLVR